jgi:hypothetical protein
MLSTMEAEDLAGRGGARREPGPRSSPQPQGSGPAALRGGPDQQRRLHPRPAGGDPGYSLSSALCAVTGCDPSARHIPDCEDLHGRVAGYLYLTGRAWSRESYLPNVIQSWEDCRPGEGWRTQAEAAGVLDHAGAVLTRAGHQPADGSGREGEELRARAVTAALEVTGDSALAAECAEAVLAVCDDEARERMADCRTSGGAAA